MVGVDSENRSEVVDEKKIRMCGYSWAYCDGRCENCAVASITYSDRTEAVNEQMR